MSITPERWKQIEELYNSALDQGPDERNGLLAKASPDVRDIVGAMLAQETKGHILDRPAWESETGTLNRPLPMIPRSIFGHYHVEETIGSGGMGEVYRAWDTRLARKVAIKSIRAGSSSQGVEARFLEEARAASALNHPNIITIYDIGSVDEQPYLVMEWIEGETLRQKLGRGPLGILAVLRIASQIADALVAAHGNGIVHRDLKPENIMVNAEGRVKVLDFGIAKRITVAEGPGPEFGLITVPGSVIGTPGYMSPEQARGEKLDFRSDHFSFGAVLYEMATGRRAFAGHSAAEVQAGILLQQPDPLTRLNPEAPAPLQWIVERCLAKVPHGRFDSTAELRGELAAIGTSPGQRASAAEPIYNLPSPPTALVGREDDLARLRELAADPSLRLLTLTGPGGIGKTRLAIELARQLAGDFAGGVCFVPLEKVSQAALAPTEVMRALGITPLPGQAVEAAITGHLRRHISGPVLLLLDNFEHVLDAAGFVAGLASDRLKIVVTSRAPLRIYGEYEFHVPSLLSGNLSGDREISPAVRLFLERASSLRGSSPDGAQLQIVSEICKRLDGLPLAIELAAARTKLLPLKTLLERLHEPLALLVGGARDMPQRQHTLRATLDWSYNLLDAEHQKLFRRMAVFVGGATIEAIEAVCDTRTDLRVNLWEAMELLVDNSLIRRVSGDDEEPRFAMLETMREYGLERLAAAGEDAYTRKAHAAYCLVLAEEAAPSMRRERSGKHRFDAELGNFRAAVDWLTSHAEVEWGLRLLIALGVYLFSRQLQLEAANRISRLVALPESDRFPRLRNWSKFWEVDLSFEGRPDTQANRYLAVWKLFEETNDREGMFQVATRIGINLRFTDVPEAARWAERAVVMSRVGFPPQVLAGSLANLADVVKVGGHLAYARALYLEAMRLFEETGDAENAIWTLSHQADLDRDEGMHAKARSLYSEALTKFKALGHLHGVASCLHDLAGLEAADGKLDEARGMYQECLRIYGSENVADLARVLESLAAVTIRNAQPERALTLAGAAAAIRERFGVRSAGSRREGMDQEIDTARKVVGAEATAHWMKGWNMNVEEIVTWAAEQGEQRWTASQQQ